MQHGQNHHENRRFHKGHERYNNTPPDELIEARGGHPPPPGDIERGPHKPVRPGGDPSEREAPSPARPGDGEDEVTGEPRERRGESIER